MIMKMFFFLSLLCVSSFAFIVKSSSSSLLVSSSLSKQTLVITDKNNKNRNLNNHNHIDTEKSRLVVVNKNTNNNNDVDIVAADLSDDDEKKKNLPQSYIILGIMLLTFIANQWSRQALYYLCNFTENGDALRHINVALNFDKEQYATLASLGFTVVFSIVSLFAGSVSDNNNRNVILALSCTVWSICTSLQGLASSYTDLVPLRALIGASQSFFNPAAYTLIADIFPKSMVGSVNGIFSSGIYLGGGLASLSILLDNILGWRKTLLIIGVFGIVAALLCTLIVPEPRLLKIENNKNVIDVTPIETKNVNLNDLFNDAVVALKEILKSDEAKLLYSATVLRFCAGFTIGIWKAPFVFAKFPGSESIFAGSNALVVSMGGLLSTIIGGYISDSLANPKDPSKRRIARAWVPAIGSLLAAPLWAAFVLIDDPTYAAVCLFFEYIVAECWFGPTLAVLFNVVPKARRGAAQGLFSMLSAVGNIAPILVGTLAGGAYGNFPLGTVLIYFISGSYVLSGLLFGFAALLDEKKISLEYNEKKDNLK